MKYLTLILLSTSVLIACTDNISELEAPLFATEQSDAGTEVLFEDLMTLQGPVYFENPDGVRFSLLDGTMVCENDYPNSTFQKVTIANYAEYDGSITDSQGNELHLADGNLSLIEHDLSLPQKHCYTETHYDVDRCPDGSNRLCWIKITYCREPWEINYRQISVERGCQSCDFGPVILDSPMCLSN